MAKKKEVSFLSWLSGTFTRQKKVVKVSRVAKATKKVPAKKAKKVSH